MQGPQGIQGPEGPQGEQGPQGPQGSPSIINGKEPDENGEITLTAADVGALPDTWRPSATDVTETDFRKFVTTEEKAAIGGIADKAGKSKLEDVTLTVAGWVEDAANGWWTQAVSNPAIVDSVKIDLSLDASALKQIMNDGSTLMIRNNAGTATVYALVNRPSVNIAVQIEIRQVMA